ncbi:MAG: glycosyltransferase family 2 protein [Anaerolineaceae bacterium]|nr:glycosyltransferase family 2 protein [Anaerolineaceae bacterium]
MKLTAVIPVFNEQETIVEVVDWVKKTNLIDEIMIVDDGSSDGTREILKQYESDPQIRVILQLKNEGKGSAVITGIHNATGDLVVIQDADLEYDPNDYAVLLKPFQDDPTTQVVYGTRFSKQRKNDFLFWNKLANRILTMITNILYFSRLTDMETCYKLFRKELADDMVLHARGFEFEPEFTAKLIKRKIKIKEVPIYFKPRDYTQGKKIKVSDAFKAIWTLIKYRFVE